jgi:uncharacterized membrane protein
MKEKVKAQYMVQAAVIGSLYAAITLLLAPLSYGVMQVRVSEALVVLSMFTPAAIPGLGAGCFFANLLGPGGFIDAAIGSIATVIGAIGTYRLRNAFYAAPMATVASNAVIVGWMLYYFYAVPLPLVSCMLWVGLGELIACYGLGIPLARFLQSRRGDIGL